LRVLASFVGLALFTACEPRYVENSADIDTYLVRGHFSSACVGLKMRGDDMAELRGYTALKLAEFPDEEDANACVCEALYSAERGWDPAVADGLNGTKRDDFATCLAAALKDESVLERHKVVYAIGAIAAPKGYDHLAEIAQGTGDVGMREASVLALRPSEAHIPLLLELLKSDPEAKVRAAAAKSLIGRDSEAVIETVAKVAVEDAEGEVRAQALNAVVKLRLPQTNKMVCTAMMDDPDSVVRLNAVKAIRGTKKPDLVKCLEQRLLTKEEDGQVREATIKALGASPSDDAALVLCNAIGPVLRMYVTGEGNQVAQEVMGGDIIKAQNDRDWERSYDCVVKARRQGGFSCYSRNYINWWYNQVSGESVKVPWCEGMPNEPDKP